MRPPRPTSEPGTLTDVYRREPGTRGVPYSELVKATFHGQLHSDVLRSLEVFEVIGKQVIEGFGIGISKEAGSALGELDQILVGSSDTPRASSQTSTTPQGRSAVTASRPLPGLLLGPGKAPRTALSRRCQRKW